MWSVGGLQVHGIHHNNNINNNNSKKNLFLLPIPTEVAFKGTLMQI